VLEGVLLFFAHDVQPIITENGTVDHTICQRGKHFLWHENTNHVINQCSSKKKNFGLERLNEKIKKLAYI